MREPYVTAVELPAFARQARAVWSEAEFETFVTFIASHPEAGDLVSGGGGMRKIRWGRAGMGKRSGVRVIYYYTDRRWPLFLFNIYAKNEKSDLSAADRIGLRKLIAELKAVRKLS
ncbi:MAG: type II toxin-antitoxin system RelE/ParE family toxin [Rhizomicrobium sp.]